MGAHARNSGPMLGARLLSDRDWEQLRFHTRDKQEGMIEEVSRGMLGQMVSR